MKFYDGADCGPDPFDPMPLCTNGGFQFVPGIYLPDSTDALTLGDDWSGDATSVTRVSGGRFAVRALTGSAWPGSLYDENNDPVTGVHHRVGVYGYLHGTLVAAREVTAVPGLIDMIFGARFRNVDRLDIVHLYPDNFEFQPDDPAGKVYCAFRDGCYRTQIDSIEVLATPVPPMAPVFAAVLMAGAVALHRRSRNNQGRK